MENLVTGKVNSIYPSTYLLSEKKVYISFLLVQGASTKRSSNTLYCII